MALNLSILYRGPLSSCNYGCAYCPFAKRRETEAEFAADRAALERFVGWIAGRTDDRFGILFTPWGEALIHPWYQDALVRLTHLPNVRRAAVQTNLSGRLGWTENCDKERLGLWATYHPTEASRKRFVERCRRLDEAGVRLSVGVVGLREHVAEIEALRAELPPRVYLWVNAYKRVERYYAEDDLARLEAVDPLFPVNTVRHPSRGLPCRTGHTVVSVDGTGTLRRCHFIKTPLGNIYEPGWESNLAERPCTNETCGCHIGYVHMPHLRLYETFGGGVLERIPAAWGSNPAGVKKAGEDQVSSTGR